MDTEVKFKKGMLDTGQEYEKVSFKGKYVLKSEGRILSEDTESKIKKYESEGYTLVQLYQSQFSGNLSLNIKEIELVRPPEVAEVARSRVRQYNAMTNA